MSQIEQIAVDRLIPYANNARVHSDEQIAQIASSIREFGFNAPVLIDKDHGIIAGHGRVAAARKLGLSEVPCIRLEHLTERQKKAYILADNKIALNSTWDKSVLNLELQELKDLGIDLSIVGFTELDLARLSDDMDQDFLDGIALNATNEPSEEKSSPSDESSEMAPLSVVLEHEQRVLVFEALRIAKKKYNLDTSGQAIWIICKEWLDNE